MAGRACQPWKGYTESNNATLLSALWSAQAPTFARLPQGAPRELVKATIEIRDPERVYSIYRASRRHHFQLLVERFILQLRYGCRVPECTTPACFSCRRRLAGTRPVRRYSPTSSRVLACQLASQDNPESALCPHILSQQDIRNDDTASAMNDSAHGNWVDTHSRSAETVAPESYAASKSPRGCRREDSNSRVHTTSSGALEAPGQPTSSPTSLLKATSLDGKEQQKIDPRSFVQNLFNTDALRMLEWLTPNSLERVANKTDKAAAVAHRSHMKDINEAAPSFREELIPGLETESLSHKEAPSFSPNAPEAIPKPSPIVDDEASGHRTRQPKSTVPDTSRSRRMGDGQPNSTMFSAPSSPSVPDIRRRDHVDLGKALKLARVNSFTDDNVRRKSSDRKPKISPSSTVKPITLFSHQGAVLPILGEVKAQPRKTTTIASSESAESHEIIEAVTQSARPEKLMDAKTSATEEKQQQNEKLPQCLEVLSVRTIDLLCNILLADLSPELQSRFAGTFVRPVNWQSGWASQGQLTDRRLPGSAKPWRTFAEQSIFYVLSDYRTLLRSFSDDSGKLLPGRLLQYCFMRISQVAPDLMLEALWIAAGALYHMPHKLDAMAGIKGRRKFDSAAAENVSEQDASNMVTLFCHALIATVPCSFSHDLTRLTLVTRAQGQSHHCLDDSGKVEEYSLLADDAYSNELALRLARRVFAAIPVREDTQNLETGNQLKGSRNTNKTLGLNCIIQSLTHFDDDSDPTTTNFEINYREPAGQRASVILLAWAKAVLMHDWDGSALVPSHGPVAGALSLHEQLYKGRDKLDTYDLDFECEFVENRLDAESLPIDWINREVREGRRREVHIFQYPFLFTNAFRVNKFRTINFSKMKEAYELATMEMVRLELMAIPTIKDQGALSNLRDKLWISRTQYLVLDISREQVLEDTFDHLYRREMRELLRPLKVKLGEAAGEFGSDLGGVQLEFFRLVAAQATNPDYGAFTVDERTKMIWLQSTSPVSLWQFELIGLIFGLALYNGCTMPVTFPRVFYKKLLTRGTIQLGMDDIEDGWPDLASGLTQLLEWDEKDGLVEDIFCRTYEFGADILGFSVNEKMYGQRLGWPQFTDGRVKLNQPKMKDLLPGLLSPGLEARMVTSANREKYVEDYIRYLVDYAIRPQFEAFQRGFCQLLEGKSLCLFTPQLLQEVLEGVQHIDMEELKKTAMYTNGYHADHRTIKDFWSIVEEYDQEQRKRLLEFVTASDRVPVGGMGGINFAIQRNGDEGGGDDEDWDADTPTWREESGQATDGAEVTEEVTERVEEILEDEESDDDPSQTPQEIAEAAAVPGTPLYFIPEMDLALRESGIIPAARKLLKDAGRAALEARAASLAESEGEESEDARQIAAREAAEQAYLEVVAEAMDDARARGDREAEMHIRAAILAVNPQCALPPANFSDDEKSSDSHSDGSPVDSEQAERVTAERRASVSWAEVETADASSGEHQEISQVERDVLADIAAIDTASDNEGAEDAPEVGAITGAEVEEQSARVNPSTARLPASMTCFGYLLLPEYKDRETLKLKLAVALENAKGFGNP